MKGVYIEGPFLLGDGYPFLPLLYASAVPFNNQWVAHNYLAVIFLVLHMPPYQIYWATPNF